MKDQNKHNEDYIKEMKSKMNALQSENKIL